jgi:hypothetical protein
MTPNATRTCDVVATGTTLGRLDYNGNIDALRFQDSVMGYVYVSLDSFNDVASPPIRSLVTSVAAFARGQVRYELITDSAGDIMS